ncbi:MAG TPA: DeoR/GlpR family DNA-binding transcription regulator [Chitinophagaceae bacterium]|jgi:DeoR/GlpR family transcriptional regulator of sugar metabolism|nr:DeoR/GlpR family DNA-binding transcription regulator [Chitinophagaceae bacterium]
MLKKERQAFILHQVNLHNKVLSASLSEELKVSEDTVRRDLQELADEGKIIKVHGGALSPSFNYTGNPVVKIYAHDFKKTIAQKAVSLIKDGMFILTSGGTTIIEIAKMLPPQLKATFISGSIPAVLEYAQHPNIEVILIGDKVSKNSKITVGGDAIAKIKQLKADLCLLGVNSIDPVHGVTDNDWDVVQVKKAMVESSQKTVCLTISEKLNTIQPIKICELTDIDMLITELPPDDQLLQSYKNAGIELL